MTAPANAPKAIRATNDGGAVRLGVLGSLSVTSSPTARTLKMATVMGCPTQAAHVPFRLIQCSIAAHATTAGAVSDRNPAMIPINRASSRTYTWVTTRTLTQQQVRHRTRSESA